MKVRTKKILLAYDKKDLDKFEELVKMFHTQYFGKNDLGRGKIMRLLFRILMDGQYEYLKLLKEIRPKIDLEIVKFEMEQMLEEKILILRKLKRKSYNKFDYDVEEHLRSIITIMCEDDYFIKTLGFKYFPQSASATYGIIPKNRVEDLFNKNFWQLNLMIDLIKDEQIYSKSFGGRKGNPWSQRISGKSKKSEKNFKKIALLRKVAEEELPKQKISDQDLCNMLKMNDREYHTFKENQRRKTNEFFNIGREDVTPTLRQKLKKQILAYLNSQ